MHYRNILIVKLSAIGDVIHALPVAQALKGKYPASKITWIVEKPAYDLLTMNPHIDEIIVFDKPKYKSWSGLIQHGPQLAKLLRARQFDLVLDLQGLGKSAAIAWLSGASRRFGYCNMRELSWLVSKPVCGAHKDGHIVERYLDVARHLGCTVGEPRFCLVPAESDRQQAEQILAEHGLTVDEPMVIIAPGTNWASKCWPIQAFSALAKMLWVEYQIPIVVIGGSKDQGLAAVMQAEHQGRIIDLTGKTNLKQLACLLQRSRLFIGGDTGPMHLAVAMDTRAVALFGPSDAERNGPYGEKHVVIRKGLSCSPCFRRTCDTMECLKRIPPEEVFAVIKRKGMLAEI